MVCGGLGEAGKFVAVTTCGKATEVGENEPGFCYFVLRPAGAPLVTLKNQSRPACVMRCNVHDQVKNTMYVLN